MKIGDRVKVKDIISDYSDYKNRQGVITDLYKDTDLRNIHTTTEYVIVHFDNDQPKNDCEFRLDEVELV